MIEVIDTAIDAVKLVQPTRAADHRGFLSEVWGEQALREAGIDVRFVSENQVLNLKANVLRGLHFQLPPFEQAKLLRVTRGRIYDVAVDLRPGSPSFGQHVGALLDAEEGRQLYVPEGFAHGFCTLEDASEVHYLLSCPARISHARGIAWNDPELAIQWRLDAEPILAQRDREHPSLAEWLAGREQQVLQDPAGAPALGLHTASAEQDLRTLIDGLEAQRCSALIDADLEALRLLCSDRLIYIHTSTRRDTKESFLRRIESGYYRYLEFERDQPEITLLDGSALVRARLRSRVIVDGIEKSLNNAILSVWTREQGRWRFVAYQPTAVPAVVPE